MITMIVLSASLLAGAPCRVSGIIANRDTGEPIARVNVRTPSDSVLAVTDSNGAYSFVCRESCPDRVVFSAIGFERETIDLKCDSTLSEVTVDTVFLVPKLLIAEGVTVVSDRPEHSKGDSYRFDNRRLSSSSGSLDDPLRFLGRTASVAAGQDFRNDLSVRGGNPGETAIVVDGLEISSISHFSLEGSSGGPFSLISAGQVENIRLGVGGQSVSLPNRLSGQTEIELKGHEGLTNGGSVCLDLSGLSGSVSQTSPEKSVYVMAHGRKSYLDLLKSRLNFPSVPRYGDASIKSGWRLSPTQTITLVSVYGADRFHLPPEVWDYDAGDVAFEQDLFFTGVIWSSTLSQTSTLEAKYALDYLRHDIRAGSTGQRPQYVSKSYERSHRLSLDFANRFSPSLEVRLGGSEKYIHADYPESMANFRDDYGVWKYWSRKDTELEMNEVSGYLETSISFPKSVGWTAGLRYDYHDYLDAGLLSPRLEVDAALSRTLSLFGSIGKYGQAPPPSWLAADRGNRNLVWTNATNLTAGIRLRASPSMDLVLTGYRKLYSDYPVVITTTAQYGQPMVDFGSDYKFYELRRINQTGWGYCRGLEITGEWSLGHLGSITVGGATLTSRYANGAGLVTVGSFDTEYQLTLAADLQPFDNVSFALHFVAAGGRPYAPIDNRLSRLYGYTIIDYRRPNQADYPPYNRLDFKTAYSHPLGPNRISIYLDIMNVYDRQNIYQYYWDSDTQQVQSLSQFRLLPVAGVMYQF